MATFTPWGKPHTILERLVESDCGYLVLANICGVPEGETRRKTLWHVIESLLKTELIGGRRARTTSASRGGKCSRRSGPGSRSPSRSRSSRSGYSLKQKPRRLTRSSGA